MAWHAVQVALSRYQSAMAQATNRQRPHYILKVFTAPRTNPATQAGCLCCGGIQETTASELKRKRSAALAHLSLPAGVACARHLHHGMHATRLITGPAHTTDVGHLMLNTASPAHSIAALCHIRHMCFTTPSWHKKKSAAHTHISGIDSCNRWSPERVTFVCHSSRCGCGGSSTQPRSLTIARHTYSSSVVIVIITIIICVHSTW